MKSLPLSIRRQANIGLLVGCAIAIAISISFGSISCVDGKTYMFDNNTIIARGPSLDDPDKIVCQEGLLLSVWQPQDNITLIERIKRGLVYFSALAYLFIGKFMVNIFFFFYFTA